MAISYPLAAADFMQLLRVQAVVPYLQFQQELSALASGGVVAKDLGPALWMADVQTLVLRPLLLEEILAAIESLQGSIGTFFLYDTLKCCPKADPHGTILGASNVKINTATSRGLSLKGLPAGYVITRGDRLSFDYGSPPMRGYHRALETVTANGSGTTPEFDVSPNIRAGAAADQTIHLIKPAVIMRIVPNSFSCAAGTLSSVQFKAQQVTLAEVPVGVRVTVPDHITRIIMGGARRVVS